MEEESEKEKKKPNLSKKGNALEGGPRCSPEFREPISTSRNTASNAGSHHRKRGE